MSESAGGQARGLAWRLTLLLVGSLCFQRELLALFGFAVTATDFLFPAAAAAFLAAVAAGAARLRWSGAFPYLGLYFAAMLVSALAAGLPWAGAAKLLTQIYLLGLAVLLFHMIEDRAGLRAAARWWLAGSALVAAAGLASLLLFALDPGHVWLRQVRFGFGTLPPGPYPRFALTFANANLLCNYLTVSLGLLLVAGRLGWVGGGSYWLLLAGILLSGALTLSPGLGGLLLMPGLWLFLLWRARRPAAARLALAAGAAAAALFVAAMAVTPILHPTAPFLIRPPGTGLVLAPSGRLMVWMQAAANFAADPLFGRGIGAAVVLVEYQSPSNFQRLTDAHNMFLNIAVQCGMIGLAALLALIAHIVRQTRPLRLLAGDTNALRLGLGLALLNGLVYHGLGGSFEDARHLWVALGMFLAAVRIEAAERSAA